MTVEHIADTTNSQLLVHWVARPQEVVTGRASRLTPFSRVNFLPRVSRAFKVLESWPLASTTS